MSASALSSASLAARAIRVRHRAQQVLEARPAEPRLRGEVRAEEVRPAIGQAKRRQRPAAALAHHLDRVHVDRVDVGPLLAVDLDVDEQLVHQLRDRRVLEALVRHHMAPVARRVADRHEHRLVGALRLRERGLAPRPPLDRVVGVLPQVRRALGGEAIRHGDGVPRTAPGVDRARGSAGLHGGHRLDGAALHRLPGAPARGRPVSLRPCARCPCRRRRPRGTRTSATARRTRGTRRRPGRRG